MKGTEQNTEREATFHTDLNEAQENENGLKQIFEQNYNCTVTTSQDKGSFPAWDLSVVLHDKDYSFTVECKMDKMVCMTGNIAVEYQRTLKDGTVRPTCISTSKADIWSYYFNSNYYLIDTDQLRQMISKKLYSRTVSNAGDGDRASVYLFPKEVFLKYATNIKKLIN